jgi:pilus assembly protein Flp/PilA
MLSIEKWMWDLLNTTRGMVMVRRLLGRFLADSSGMSAVEYGLIAAGISLVIIVALSGMGGNHVD